ncbi:hypothetical protein HOA92_00435 [archaeon]|jgi:D-3-phosphoglycerate dehydrogenase / 2-oxoglutarate reductase|nr:hypothetical protein [archaeon]MBT6761485.1 hypothetical protein [archaeon]
MNIQILHKNRDLVSTYFQEAKYQVTQNNQEVETIVSGGTNELSKEQLQLYPNLRNIIHCCNGTNTIDINFCKQNNIQIFNSPTANINATAEHTVALILSTLRKITQANKSMKQGNWNRDQYFGKEINECQIGFIGFGRIARLVNQKLSNFNPKKILAYDPFLTQEQMGENTTKVELTELFKEADIISLHLPLLESTRHMISKDQFDLMKTESILVNCSRGGIIDESALIGFLNKNQAAAAALDVFENEPNVNQKLFELPNLTLTPHLGSMSKKAQLRMITEAKENFEAKILNTNSS